MFQQQSLRPLICLCHSGLDTTLHRVVDVIKDRLRAVDMAVELGFSRILTSGGAQNADIGAFEIGKMV